MSRLMLALVFFATTAQSDDLKSFKIEAEIEAGKLKGVPCVLKSNGASFQFSTPADVEILFGEDGLAFIESLSCKYKGVTLSTPRIPDERTISVTFDFEPGLGPVYFYKKNGGLTGFIQENGEFAWVR